MTSDSWNPQKAEGVSATTIGADKWHAAGITGKGIKLGVLDLGFGGVKAQLGDFLPENVETNISIDKMDKQKEDHGTAVAMVVHSIAPDAELYLAYFDGISGGTGLVKALQWLQQSGVQAINYSVGSTVGPRNGQFGDAVLFDAFTRETGIPVIVAAGNSAQEHTLLKFNEGENGLHLFGEDEDGNQVYAMPFAAAPVYSIVMNWDGNWDGKEKSEYDFFVLDEDGNTTCVGNEPRRGRKNDYPLQIQMCEGDPDKLNFLVIQRKRGSTENILDIFIEPALLVPWAQVPQLSVGVPADADGVLSVGAVGLTNDALEEYSSQGPTMDERLKPEISAPTGESLPGYDKGFFGTSGAAPVVTGAAGLILQAFPDMTSGELKAYLMENVVDLGEKGPDIQFGNGRLSLPEPGGDGSIEGNTGGGDEGGSGGGSEQGVAVIDDVRVKFGVKVKREVGLQIKVNFELDNFEGKQMVVAALFFDADGNAVPSSDPDYDANGTIGVGIAVKPKRNQTAFKNVTLFVPNSAFEDVTEDELYFVVIAADATDPENWVKVAQSDPVQIQLEH
ncbi:MAG: S8 family serine peptidase [Anaerolineae bacterium]